jgi:type I restriction enzyme S subunit
MEDNSPKLPKGWAWTNINEIISPAKNAIKRGPFGSAIKKAFFVEKGFKVYEQGNAIYNDFRRGNYYLSKDKFEELASFEVKPGEFIISCSGTIGKIAQVPNNAERGIINQALLKMATDPRLISPKYFLNLFRSEGFQKKILGGTRGVAITNINSVKDLKTLAFALPPLPEQHRIVAKIDELFTKLDAGVEALKKVKAQLKRYRQAVLKYAFEGKLTQEWREANKDKLEPASVLLDRIKEERIKNAKGKIEDFPPLDNSDLAELPETWTWARLGVCSNLITKGESPNWQGFNYVDEGIPFIRSENVLWGKMDFSGIVKIPHEFHKKLKRSHIRASDVLINLVGASIGRCCIVPAIMKEANINQAVALIRAMEFLRPDYLMHLLLSPNIQNVIHGSKVETARPNISLKDLNQLAIPLSPPEEQEKVVEEIEGRFSRAEEIEKTILQGLKQSERLRQSILKTAFEGKLAPQEPTDEPAERLLERIKVEKSKRESETKSRRKKSNQMELI